MPSHFTRSTYQSIVDRAWQHVLAGGGILPTSDGENVIEDAIAAVAAEHFAGAEAQRRVDEVLARLDAAQREHVLEAMWSLVSVFAESGFTFGAAVAVQLHQTPVPVSALGGRS